MTRTSLIGGAVGALALVLGAAYWTVTPRPATPESGTMGRQARPGEAPSGASGGVADPLALRRTEQQPDIGRSAGGGGASSDAPTTHAGASVGGAGGQVAVAGARKQAGSGQQGGVGPAPKGAAGDGGAASDLWKNVPPSSLADRAGHLPERAPDGQHGPEAGADATNEKADGKQPDVLLSLPFKGDTAPEGGGAPLKADGVEVNGGNVEFTDQGMMRLPVDGNVNGDAGTVAFQISPTWAGTDPTDHSFVQILSGDNTWENRMAVVKNLDALRFIMIDDTGVEHNVGVPITDWEAGQPHQVAATWGDALMTLYVDGVPVGQSTYQGTMQINPAGSVLIGYNDPASTYRGPGGTMSTFKIYGRALGADEVPMP